MNPETGEFHDVEGYEQEHGEPPPEDWPIFTLGEEVEVKGIPFFIQRINVSTLVLRPKVSKVGERASDVIALATGRAR